VKAFLDEEGSDVVHQLLLEDAPAASSRIAHVECQAAFARTARERRISRAQLGVVRRTFEERWGDLIVIELGADLAGMAGRLVHDQPLRAADAIHLASAISLAAGVPDDTRFACWDGRLWTAAAHHGFRMTPAALSFRA